MKKLIACILTVVSLACIVLLAYFLLSNPSIGAGLRNGVLPIVGALATAYAAGKLFGAEERSVSPAPNQA